MQESVRPWLHPLLHIYPLAALLSSLRLKVFPPFFIYMLISLWVLQSTPNGAFPNAAWAANGCFRWKLYKWKFPAQPHSNGINQSFLPMAVSERQFLRPRTLRSSNSCFLSQLMSNLGRNPLTVTLKHSQNPSPSNHPYATATFYGPFRLLSLVLDVPIGHPHNATQFCGVKNKG